MFDSVDVIFDLPGYIAGYGVSPDSRCNGTLPQKQNNEYVYIIEFGYYIAVQISAREPAPVARQPRPDQPAGPAASRPQPREDRHRPREDGGGGQVRSYWSTLPLY